MSASGMRRLFNCGVGMKRVNNWVRVLFEEYKFSRRFALFWAMGLITYSVLRFFELTDKVDTPHATVIVAIIGVLATVIAFYQWHRQGDK